VGVESGKRGKWKEIILPELIPKKKILDIWVLLPFFHIIIQPWYYMPLGITFLGREYWKGIMYKKRDKPSRLAPV
jgi:hypothetical protein